MAYTRGMRGLTCELSWPPTRGLAPPAVSITQAVWPTSTQREKRGVRERERLMKGDEDIRCVANYVGHLNNVELSAHSSCKDLKP